MLLDPEQFDFPSYGGLPSKVFSVLSPEAVDAVQNLLPVEGISKNKFVSTYLSELIRLGESTFLIKPLDKRNEKD